MRLLKGILLLGASLPWVAQAATTSLSELRNRCNALNELGQGASFKPVIRCSGERTFSEASEESTYFASERVGEVVVRAKDVYGVNETYALQTDMTTVKYENWTKFKATPYTMEIAINDCTELNVNHIEQKCAEAIATECEKVEDGDDTAMCRVEKIGEISTRPTMANDE